MVKDIASELTQRRAEGDDSSLAGRTSIVSMWRRHYSKTPPGWEPYQQPDEDLNRDDIGKSKKLSVRVPGNCGTDKHPNPPREHTYAPDILFSAKRLTTVAPQRECHRHTECPKNARRHQPYPEQSAYKRNEKICDLCHANTLRRNLRPSQVRVARTCSNHACSL